MWLVVVFELFMLYSTVAGECHCYNASACTSSPATTCRQHGGCIEGWYGPTCQKQNVALKRPTDVSSVGIYNESDETSKPLKLTPDHAVDGITSDDSPCAQTKLDDGLPEWGVFLNTSNHDKIYHMKLYLSKTRKEQYDDMIIAVDDQLCYNWSLPERPDSITEVTCRQPLSGANIFIYGLRDYLTVCEVQVFVCSDGWFGDDCDKQCHCLDKKEVCDKITGHCISGCSPGFSGPNCQSVCSDGWFGYNCDKRCRCRNNKEVCNKTTGHCSSGCAPGFSGVNCQTQNVALKRKASASCEYHGLHTNSQSLNQTADYLVDGIPSGICSGPCAHTNGGGMTPSWTVILNISRHDKIRRMKLYYGENSPSSNKGMEIFVDKKSCYAWSPNGLSDSTTDFTCTSPLTGTSVTIQKQQEFLTLCEVQILVCSDGWFGGNCDKQCHCLDNKEVCDKITGHCLSGCTSGFRSVNCQLDCKDGWFGDNCDKKCHCRDNEVCSKIAGHCPSGCISPFSGTNCQTENVALRRPANQTSVHYETRWKKNLPADLAVDGKDVETMACARTGDGDMNPSWTVYLTTRVKIHRMKLYQNEICPVTGGSRNAGMKIYVENKICYEWSPTERFQPITDVTCTQPLSGTNVTIRTPQENLTLCEVQIFVCSDGWFGDGCVKQCHCLDEKEVCDKITGQCLSGCNIRFSGADCQSLYYQLDAVNNESSDQPAAYLITSAVAVSCGLVMLVMLVIVLVASLCIRRLRMKIKVLEKTRGEPYVPLDQATREEMPEPCYSVIADNRYDPRYMNSSV